MSVLIRATGRFAVALLLLACASAQQFSSLAAPPPASYFEPADMDGDGFGDMLAVREAGIWLHRNDGTNRMGPGVLMSNVVGTYVGTTADFDGDGSRDLIAFARSSVSSPLALHLLRNLGTGYATSVVFQPTVSVVAVRFLRALDLENDGDQDLVGGVMVPGGATSCFVVANDGVGGFSNVTATWWPNLPTLSDYDIQTLDVDGDGRMDLLLSTFMRLLRNTGTSFVDESALRLPALANFFSFSAQGDIDGDGDGDLLVNASNLCALWRNTAGVFVDASAQLAPGANQAASGAFFDADGDNDLDLYMGRWNLNAQSMLLWNNGSGGLLTGTVAPRFGPELVPVHPPLTSGTRQITVADLDNDGDYDLVYAGNGISVLRNAGGASLVDPLAAVRVPGEVAVPMDIDSDGDVDLLLVGQYAENDGFGGFTLRSFAGTAPNVSDRMAVGDVDGDGDLDLASDASLYRNNGGASFAATPLPVTVGAFGIHRFGDYDGDGDLDLALTTSATPEAVHLLGNNGSGTFAVLQTLATPGWALTALDAGDYDGDGDLDLLVGGSFGGASSLGSVQVVENQGTAGFVPGAAIGPISAAHARFASLTGSGSLDIVLDQQYPTRLRIFRQQASVLVEVTASVVPAGFTSSQTAIGDVDGDGDIDIAGHQLLRNDGTGTFALEALGPAAAANDSVLRLVDLDGDGDLDLLRRTMLAVAQGSTHWHYVAWNHEHQLVVPLPAKGGRTLQVEANALPGRATAQELAFVGASMQRQAPGLPTPFGELRLGSIVTTWLAPIAPVVGLASFGIAIPANPAFIGIELHFQALHFGPAGFVLGNVASTAVE